MGDKLLKTGEVAEFLRVHPETVRRLARLGKIEGIRLEGRKGGYRFTKGAIDRFLETRKPTP